MSANKPVGVGFIGAGEISILHAKAVQAIPEARLVGLWNRTRSRAEERAKLFGCAFYDTPEDLVKDPDIDAVFVLTDLDTHLQYTKLALEHGKHVLVEKPLGATVAEVEEMKCTAERLGLVCVPGHNMIHEDSLARARALIQDGNIGKIVSCYVMYNIHHSEERAATLPGMVRHILQHNIYTMMYLVGRPTRVAAMKAVRHYETLTKEDLAMVLVDLECGGVAHLCASFAADDLSADPWTFMVKVIGTEGTTRYTYQDWVEAKRGISHSRLYTAYQGTITNEDRHFVNVCLKGGQPLSTMEDAIISQKVVEAVEKSLAEDRIVSIT
ncbi:Gfo/Idh/MocA family protein [Aggregatilinea lenta]|uniref:Gfo/Idh/MocA family protein n=1 Tax=Aggregatilinea lenta TaxID=913108 RepID=UPI000E5C3764|nr:Gfo/Idh/MocA family oxidoreductase [Aggregatilinea lenta]